MLTLVQSSFYGGDLIVCRRHDAILLLIYRNKRSLDLFLSCQAMVFTNVLILCSFIFFPIIITCVGCVIGKIGARSRSLGVSGVLQLLLSPVGIVTIVYDGAKPQIR
jgi:hypothetical protein